MAAKTIRVARHVYLRTQQRRLHQVKSILIRNLALPEPSYHDPLDVSVYFSIHSTYSPKRVLYKSGAIEETNNPSWESVEFSPQQFGKYASLGTFIIRLWVRSGGSPDNDYCLVHEKTVELSELSYLGSFVNKDGSGYPPNSIVFGMFEGYYSYPGVGGVPCPPKVTHSLSDFLPPQSLLEVHKTEVRDSYQHLLLTRILNRQEVLNRARDSARQLKEQVESCSELERTYFSRRSAREQLRTRVELLRRQVVEQEAMEEEEAKRLSQLKSYLDSRENDLRKKQEELRGRKMRYEADSLEHSKKRDQLVRTKRNQQLRQRNMIFQLTQTYFIREVKETYTVCNVILPNADQLDQPNSVEQLGVALGYVSGLVYHLSRVLLVPLQYPIKPNGSRSYICDCISDETLIDNIKEFPLFARGVEKALLQYAVHLLNKDIAQVRQYCGYGTSKSMFKKTLPNLKTLLDKITRDVVAPKRPDGTAMRMSLPIDTASLSSYMGRDRMSSVATTVSMQSHSSGPEFMPPMSPHTTSRGSPTLAYAVPPRLFRECSPGGDRRRVPPRVVSETLAEEDGEDVRSLEDTSPLHLREASVPVASRDSHPTLGPADAGLDLESGFCDDHDETPFSASRGSRPRQISQASSNGEGELKSLSLSDAALLATESEDRTPSDPDERLPSSLDSLDYPHPPENEPRTRYHHDNHDVEDAAQLVLGLISSSPTREEALSSEGSQGPGSAPAGSSPIITGTTVDVPAVALTESGQTVGSVALPIAEKSGSYSGVAMIPPEIALAFRQSPEAATQLTSHSENSFRFHSELHAAAHKVRYATYGDSGTIKTGVATPHIITNQDGETGSPGRKNLPEASYPRAYSSSQFSDSDAQFLEDFIDSPSGSSRNHVQPRTSMHRSDGLRS